ncbi:MAG: phage tail spike protein [Streptococcus salivarius]|nr:phage tail spike protein [Streptococcus salivarius]
MIYLFDKDEKLIKIIRKPAIKKALQKFSLTTENYISDRLTVEMKALKDDELAKLEYMAIQSIDDTHKFHYFYIAQGNTKGDITTLIGVQSGIEELRKTVVYDKRPKDQRARPVIEWLLTGTNWTPRFIAETNPKSTNFYYISTFDALKKVCKVWGLEMQFFVEMNGAQIGARYIDFKRKIGEAVGKRVVYGHNALEILQEVEKTNLYTALVGRGKGEQVSSAEDTGKDADGYGRKINFEEIVWSKAKGDPLDKPLGQKYLEIPEMTAKYGIKQPDGKMRPKIGFVEFSEEEDKNELIKQTYEALIEASRPKLTLKTTTVYLKGARIGDTIRVVRHDRHLDYDTRIFEITFNRLNDESSDVKLGDRVGESNDAKVQSTVNKALDEFKAGEFTEFVKKLPEFIPSANGFNHNWYTSTDPTESHPGQVLINDSWYKPDPEHEGHTIMYRWTGEMWQEVLRTWDGTGLQDKIKKEFEKVAANMAKQQSEHDRVVAEITAKATNAETLASSAKSTAEDAFNRLNDVKSEAIAEARYLDTVERAETEKKIAASKKDALSEAVKLVDNAKSTLNTDLSETEKRVEALKGSIGTLSNDTSVQFAKINNALISVASKQDVDKVSQRVSNAETVLTQQAGQISAKASKEDVNAVSGRLNKAESSLTVQAGQISQKANKQDVDTLTGRVNRAETSITQQADMIASKANKQELDNVNNRVINAESRITQQANEISQRVKTSDFNNATQRLATAESSITQLGNKITTEISRVDSKIPTDFGSRNLILKSADFSNVHSYTGRGNNIAISTDNASYIINSNGNSSNFWGGVSWNMAVSEIRAGETFSLLVPCYIDSRTEIGNGAIVAIKNNKTNAIAFEYQIPTAVKDKWFDVTLNFTATKDTNLSDFPFGIYVVRNGYLKIKPPMLVRGALIPLQHTVAPEDTEAEISTVKTTITQTEQGVSQLSQKQSETDSRITNAETTVNQLVDEVSSKVSKTDFDKLSKSVAANSTSITQTDNKISLKADRTEVQTAKATADSAVSKGQELERKINQTNAELRVTADSIAQKVSRVDFDNLGNKVTNAETQISTLAGKIETKLSRVDLDSAIDSKGFLKESDVNRLVDNKGFATATAVTNLIQQSERGTTQLISEVKKQIPSVDTLSAGGENLIRNSAFPENLDNWGFWQTPQQNPNLSVSQHPYYYNSAKPLFLLKTSSSVPASTPRFSVKRNTDYSFNFQLFATGNIKGVDIYFLGRKSNETSKNYTKPVRFKAHTGSPSVAGIVKWHLTFNSGECDEGYIRIDNTGTTNGSEASLFFTELDCYEGTMDRSWQPSPKDATQEVTVKFNEIKSTVDGFSRTIGEHGKSISQIIQDAKGTVWKVENLEDKWAFNLGVTNKQLDKLDTGLEATKSEMSQIAGSWAVKNLTRSGDVLNQINLNKDGSVKIDGKLVQITGSTYIEDGVISSAKIGELSASKITSGRLNASLIDVVNLNASSITSGTFTGLNYRGGRMEGLNGSMKVDLNKSEIHFFDNATIEFHNKDNAIVRRKGTHTAFVHFNDTPPDEDEGVGSLFAAIGVTSSGDGINSASSGRFSGLRVYRAARGLEHNAVFDQAELYGDRILLKDDFYFDRGYSFHPASLPKGRWINVTNLGFAAAALARVWQHFLNVGGNGRDPAFINALKNEQATFGKIAHW